MYIIVNGVKYFAKDGSQKGVNQKDCQIKLLEVLSSLRQLLATETPLKLIKSFLFYLEISFCFQDI